MEAFAPFLPIVGALLALVSLFFAFKDGRQRRLIDNLPTSKTTGVFIGLVCVYAVDFFASLKPDLPRLGGLAERALGFFRLGTGFWLMYLVFAVALNFILKYTLPL